MLKKNREKAEGTRNELPAVCAEALGRDPRHALGPAGEGGAGAGRGAEGGGGEAARLPDARAVDRAGAQGADEAARRLEEEHGREPGGARGLGTPRVL